MPNNRTLCFPNFKILFFKFATLLGVYLLLRILFFVFNKDALGDFSTSEILYGFLWGFRFDTASIFLINSPFILLALIPHPKFLNRFYDILLNTLLIGMNSVFFIINLIDFEYYKFTGSRITLDILLYKNEAATQLSQFFVNYWLVFLIGAILIACSTLLLKKKNFHLSSHSIQNYLKWSVASFFLLVVTIVGARGGVQMKVIQPFHAYMVGRGDLGVLALNSSFTVLKSKLSSRMTPANYFKTNSEAISNIPFPHLNRETQTPQQNVVILILESFATEFWGYANKYPGYTPFLDSLAKKGLFFKNNFANGRRSIEALPSVLFGMPSLMSTPIVKSVYQRNKWVGLGTVLSKHGYHTSFFHGAMAGTMYFDAIAAQAGLDDYYPLERYPHKGDFDGNWGIYDEPFLQFMATELNKHKEPFFSVAFTISTHQPYMVPPQYKGKFPAGELKIHESIGYADHALKKFFETAEKQPWFKNTLFVITGDHTQMSKSRHYTTDVGRYMVPLLIYHPTTPIKDVDTTRVTQHTDIFPSVLDYLGVKDEAGLLFGRSIFDQSSSGEAVFHLDGRFWLVKDQRVLKYLESSDTSFLYQLEHNDSNTLPLITDLKLQGSYLKQVKSYIQYFRNGLIDNSLYSWRTSHKDSRTHPQKNSHNATTPPSRVNL